MKWAIIALLWESSWGLVGQLNQPLCWLFNVDLTLELTSLLSWPHFLLPLPSYIFTFAATTSTHTSTPQSLLQFMQLRFHCITVSSQKRSFLHTTIDHESNGGGCIYWKSNYSWNYVYTVVFPDITVWGQKYSLARNRVATAYNINTRITNTDMTASIKSIKCGKQTDKTLSVVC